MVYLFGLMQTVNRSLQDNQLLPNSGVYSIYVKLYVIVSDLILISAQYQIYKSIN
jgi:hypothetical protein